jgi:hypothetical protein
VAHDPIPHAEASRLPEQDPAEIFHEILFLAFHDEKAVRDQAAENESHLFAAGVRGLGEFALEQLEGKWLEVVELLEGVGHGWGGVGVDAEFLQLVVSHVVSGFLGANAEQTSHQCQAHIERGHKSGPARTLHASTESIPDRLALASSLERPKMAEFNGRIWGK